MQTYDATVIGAGPCGLTAALYLCRFGLKTALLERFAPGGQLLNTFEITNYPGFPKGTPGWELADGISKQLDEYTLDRINKGVTSIARDGDHYVLSLENGNEHHTRTVLICSGASPKKLGLPDEARFIGRGMSFCAMCDGMFFRNKTIAVVGGGNSALEEALQLSKIVKHIYLIHRREDFRADKVIQDKLLDQARNVTVLTSYVVGELHGDPALTGLTLNSTSGGESRRIDVEGLFVFIGITPSASFLPEGLERDGLGFIVTDVEMRTNLAGIFAAGDIRSKECRQVVTAVGDGATAAHAAHAYLEKA